MNEFLFLDIDDVLNSRNYFAENTWIKNEGYDPDEHPRCWIDESAVHCLNQIIERSDADLEIVLSSTWRHTFGPEEMTEILRDRGFNHSVESKTPGKPDWSHQRGYAGWGGGGHSISKDRGTHIRNFLVFKRNVDEVETLLVIDNLPIDELEPFGEYVVQTRPEDGLCDRHVQEALNVVEKPVTGINLKPGGGSSGSPTETSDVDEDFWEGTKPDS